MLHAINILIADPSPYLAGLTAAMLKGVGARTAATVHDSAAVLLALHRTPFDVLVLDDRLEPIDGIALTRQIRAGEVSGSKTLPIVMVFAEASRERIEAARDAGVTEFLKKPMSAKMLEVRITQALDRPRPFVEVPAYVGPDRRRRAEPAPQEERRLAALPPGAKDADDDAASA